MDILTIASILVPVILLVVAFLRQTSSRLLFALAACLLLGGLVFVLSGALVSLGVFVLNFGRAGLCLAASVWSSPPPASSGGRGTHSHSPPPNRQSLYFNKRTGFVHADFLLEPF